MQTGTGPVNGKKPSSWASFGWLKLTGYNPRAKQMARQQGEIHSHE
jgi:hypothetical protein